MVNLKKNAGQESSEDYNLAVELMKEKKDLRTEKAEIDKKLVETASLASILFLKEELNNVISPIREIANQFDCLELKAIQTMRKSEGNVKSESGATDISLEAYNAYLTDCYKVVKPIDDLLDFMKSEINEEPPLWRTW